MRSWAETLREQNPAEVPPATETFGEITKNAQDTTMNDAGNTEEREAKGGGCRATTLIDSVGENFKTMNISGVAMDDAL